MDEDHVEIALLRQRVDQLEKRENELSNDLSVVKKLLREQDKQIFAARVGFAVLVGIGLFLGFAAGLGDMVRKWFR